MTGTKFVHVAGGDFKPVNLDVGCGSLPTGDINTDLFTGKSPHLTREIKPQSIPNFVKSDIHFLPFRNETFYQTYCAHVLEHEGVNAGKAIKELIRVSQRMVVIKVPHRFNKIKQHETHNKRFNISVFDKYFNKIGYNSVIEISQYRFIPKIFFCLWRVPSEITVKVLLK